MGNWFGRSKKKEKSDKITSVDEATLELKLKRDELKQYRKKLEGVVARETEIARELHRQGKRDRAILVLKKKKYQLHLLEQTEAALGQIEQLVVSVEFAERQREWFDGMKSGTEALKVLNKELSIEAVENLMDDTREAQEHQQIIGDMLAENLSGEEGFDDESLEAELAKIMGAESGAESDKPVEFPSVPTKDPTAAPAETAAAQRQAVPAS
mmetsp:Transcript_448/g.809  ORF Transcript_448/g.809 Transcript_448/m.809 type:complete len:212 (+) Transcript_448:14-649(+)